MIPESTHQDLMNWRRFSWSGPLPHPLPPTRAASAEGRWIPPSDLGHEIEARPVPINKDRATKIQALWDGEVWAVSERWVMWAEYIYRHQHMRIREGFPYFDRGEAARAVGYPPHVYETALRSAARLVEATLGD